MAANRESVEALHTALTEFWSKRLIDAKAGGESALTAAEATALAKFLKDNNVTAILGSTPAGKNVLDSLPFGVEGDTAE
ncbi:hypothetical protein UFOVP823_21 [uncultured Caudovirales phage]|uniref:Uncharacterized protein n=1 Tax=uncultured Caudovirales phage TaxID=2100421 RepID=A0A6J5P1T8_9CAUD|nr:hypothetical protein UFOVP823_21 [uncultured Caudovirales phage]